MAHCWTRLIYPYTHRKPVLEYSGAEAANASSLFSWLRGTGWAEDVFE